jgi:hypothetical protein
VQEGLWLGSKDELTVSENKIEWFDPEAISRYEETALSGLPDGKRPHAVKAMQAIGTPLQVCF